MLAVVAQAYVGVAFRSEDPIDVCVGEQLMIVAGMPSALARPGICAILEELRAAVHLQTVLVVASRSRIILSLGWDV